MELDSWGQIFDFWGVKFFSDTLGGNAWKPPWKMCLGVAQNNAFVEKSVAATFPGADEQFTET